MRKLAHVEKHDEGRSQHQGQNDCCNAFCNCGGYQFETSAAQNLLCIDCLDALGDLRKEEVDVIDECYTYYKHGDYQQDDCGGFIAFFDLIDDICVIKHVFKWYEFASGHVQHLLDCRVHVLLCHSHFFRRRHLTEISFLVIIPYRAFE